MKIPKFVFVSLFFAAFLAFLPNTVSAKDEWLQVRSKNFFLIGNAPEKDIRNVATRLEQFRESFRLIFGAGMLNASVPTTVVVFKSASSYKPFKPKRSDGKTDNFVAGYFQPGEDVNYVTLSTDGTDEDTFGTIYHEYVHFLLNTTFGKSEVPPWFNEGLAEYYQTFAIEKDQIVKLGMHQDSHILLLRENKLISLGTFFNINNRTLHQNGNHSKSIFYAQAWALIHYLTLNQKAAGLKKFLALSMANKPAEHAFQEAFGIGYAEMEKELRKYVGMGSFKYMQVPLKAKLVFDAEMHVSPLDDADSNAYLGDLLYHTHRVDDAEPLLKSALAMKPDSSMANTTLGMVKIDQRKFDEAQGYLEKAIAQDQKNHLALYRYAFLLSREGRDEFGYVQKFETATAAKMRQLLKKAIALSPTFTESYELLAFVNLVNNEELDDAVLSLNSALKYQPGNARYAMRIAEIYLRQDKFKEAAAIAEKLAKSTDDDEVRSRATQLANDIKQREEMMAQYEQARKHYESRPASGTSGGSGGERVLLTKRPGEAKPSAEQISRSSEEFRIRAMNQSLRALEAGEKQVLGRIAKIDCKGGVTYSIKTDTETFQLTSKDFQTLSIITFIPDAGDNEVGCNSNLASANAVISYRPGTFEKSASRGELVAVEFVPTNFRFVDLKAEAPPPTFEVEEAGPPQTEGDFAERRRRAMMDAIRDRIRKPSEGEKREIGFIERSECTNKGAFIHIKAGTQILKLVYPETTFMGGYTPEVEGVQLGCGMKSVDIPVVFIFKPSANAKAKAVGELVSLEFVPKSFTLN